MTLTLKNMESARTTSAKQQRNSSAGEVAALLKNRYLLAKSSLLFFMADILGLEIVPHLKEWDELQRRHRYLKIEGARDITGKTTFWSFAFPLWHAAFAPNQQICIISYSLEQVVTLTAKCQQEIERNDFFLMVRPVNKTTWTKTAFCLANGSEINAKSFGSPIRSAHYDYIIIDDPIKDFGGMSREDQLTFFRGVIMPALKSGGQMIVVGTPIDSNDLLSAIDANPIFHSAFFPAYQRDGSSIWPSRWSLEQLSERKAMMGSWLFGREYLLSRLSPETAPLKKAHLKYYSALPSEPISYFMAVDPALSTEETADWTAIVIGAVTSDNCLYLTEIVKAHISALTQIKEIIRLYLKWKPELIGLETVAFQKVIKEWLYEECRQRCVTCGRQESGWEQDTTHKHIKGLSLPVKELNHAAKHKNTRIMGLQPRIEAGRLFIRAGMTDVENQVENFRLETEGEDDVLDAVASLEEIISCPVLREAKPLPPSGLDGCSRREWESLHKSKELVTADSELGSEF